MARRRKDYYKYTEQQKAEARETDMVDFLQRYRGFSFRQVGSYYICNEHDSLNVERDRKKWHWNSQQIGGLNAIDWLINVEDMDFRSALDVIIGRQRATTELTFKKAEVKPQEEKVFELPVKTSGQFNAVYSYLTKTRGIDNDVLQYCFHKHIIYQDEKWNCVFVGFDDSGKARFAEQKPSSTDDKFKGFRGNIYGSEKEYSFNIRSTVKSDTLFVFESPIDLLSHCSLSKLMGEERCKQNGREYPKDSWQKYNRLSLSGTSDRALLGYLNRYPDIKNVALCLDNDDAGLKADKKLKQELEDNGYKVSVYKSSFGKDYNDMLLNYINTHKQSEDIIIDDYEDDKASYRR